MTERFTGSTALVTGGGSGIGRAVALAFAREGAFVVVAGRRAEPLEGTVKLIQDAGGTASAVTADVTDAEDMARLMEETARRCGRLDIAVNNAGTLTAADPVADIDEREWRTLLEVNVTGVLLAMGEQIRHMRGRGGTIVNVSSNIGTHLRIPGIGAYAASKAAVTTLTRAAALEYIGEGIRINAVSPGASDTPMSLLPGETEEQRAARMREQVPIGRIGALEEIAPAVLYLASPESGFAVGTDLVLDGGAAA
ncbi:SDR family NAD(P)-dependent oxidoreductase [Allosalinactinospora lopnorensis]|uniref:SDR family NAD(P)-dependent oxidoreductase n=1 Tax=Allosalinactinospora lopnorensis TaxID=1352348 RepID=UPI000623D669|nr:SDR family oxidoreductase [Allosalinactinospora lopnorensis]